MLHARFSTAFCLILFLLMTSPASAQPPNYPAIRQAALKHTTLELPIDVRWCSRTFKTVVGSGSDICMERIRKGKKDLLVEEHILSRGANYRKHGYDSPIETTTTRHKLRIEGCILHLTDKSFSAAICGDQLLLKAVVPAGPNTWLHHDRGNTLIYEFEQNPMQQDSGRVNITRIAADPQNNFRENAAFSAKSDRYGRQIEFVDDQNAYMTRVHTEIYFQKQFAQCAVGQLGRDHYGREELKKTTAEGE